METYIYSNVSIFHRQATFQSGPKMWKRVYIEMFPHLKYDPFSLEKNMILFNRFLSSTVVAITELA